MTALLIPNNGRGHGSAILSKDFSKTPNLKERQQGKLKRFQYSVAGVDEDEEHKTLETAQAASFLPAVQGQEHFKKKVNKAQFLTINESEKEASKKEELASLSSFRVSENNPHIHRVREIITTCLREGHQGAGLSHRSGKGSPFKYIDHAMTEISMKKKDLDLVLGIMRDLEGNETVTFE